MFFPDKLQKKQEHWRVGNQRKIFYRWIVRSIKRNDDKNSDKIKKGIFSFNCHKNKLSFLDSKRFSGQ